MAHSDRFHMISSLARTPRKCSILTLYCYDEAERDEAQEKLKGAEVTRFKGLGEINPQEFKQFMSDDEHLTPVDVNSMGAVHKILDFLMGKNTPARKQFIVNNLRSDVI